jgi:hypothetical protein
MTMRATGEYATFRGREYPVVARGSDDSGEYVGLLLSDDDVGGFDRVTERRSGGRMATVGRDALERYERVVTTGTVDGVEVTLLDTGDPAECYVMHARDWAIAHGFSGSAHDGYSGSVPRDDIDDIHETVTDLLRPADAGGGR